MLIPSEHQQQPFPRLPHPICLDFIVGLSSVIGIFGIKFGILLFMSIDFDQEFLWNSHVSRMVLRTSNTIFLEETSNRHVMLHCA